MWWFVACGQGDGTDATDAVAVVPVDCAQLGADFPEPRGDHAGVWDAARGRFVLFGGDVGVPVECSSQSDFSDETWAFVESCSAWQSLGGGATARGRHVAALDGDRMVIHGGRFRNGTSGDYKVKDDTWTFDLATDTWTEVLTTGTPEARSSHAGAMVGGRLVIFGGNASDDGLVFEPLVDTQALDLTTGVWEKLDTANKPSARLFHVGASDGTNRLFIFGGGDEGAFIGPFFSDLWELSIDTGKWKELDSGSGPRGRIQANLLYDASKDRLLMWGGHDDGTLGNSNELWEFDLGAGAWTQLIEGDAGGAPANGFCDFPVDFTEVDLDSPERRSAGAAALTPDGALWVMGGKSDCGSLDDVWLWSGNAWSNPSRATSGESCTRASSDCSTLCF